MYGFVYSSSDLMYSLNKVFQIFSILLPLSSSVLLRTFPFSAKFYALENVLGSRFLDPTLTSTEYQHLQLSQLIKYHSFSDQQSLLQQRTP